MLRRELVEEIAPKLSTQRFKLLIDIVVTIGEELRIAELPYSFRDQRLAERSRLLQRACSSDQASLSRATVVADSPPASLPSSATSASSKSPVEMPLR